MKQLTLIPSDFNRLDITCGYGGTFQYSSLTDCPICRAAKRAGLDVKDVSPGQIDLNNGTVIKSDNFFMTDVERCRLELLAGATEAIITI